MNALATLRKRIKFSQSEMAVALGVSQGSVSFYEKGTIVIPPPIAGKAIALAAAHGIELSYDDIYSPQASTQDESPATEPGALQD